MSILKKPDIQYKPEDTKPADPPARNTIGDLYTLEKPKVIQMANELDDYVDKAYAAIEEDMRSFAVIVNDSEINNAISSLTNINNADIVSFNTFIMASSINDSNSRPIKRAYSESASSVWGNASLKMAEIIKAVSIEQEKIKTYLKEVNPDEDALILLAGWINDAKRVCERSIEIINNSAIDEDLFNEMSVYTPTELRSAQIYLDNYSTSNSTNADKAIDTLRRITSDVNMSSAYDRLADTSTPSLEGKTDGAFGALINSLYLHEAQDSMNNKSKLTNRFRTFTENAMKAMTSIGAVKIAQNINKTAYEALDGLPPEEAAGISVVNEEIATLHDESIMEQYRPQIASLREVIQKPEEYPDLSSFISNETFNKLKDKLFYNGKLSIDGSNIKAGTLEAGALRIGDRPLDLDIIWVKNMAKVNINELDFVDSLYTLSHKDANVVLEHDGQIYKVPIPSGSVKIVNTDTLANEEGQTYFLYLSIKDDFTQGTVIAFTTENKPKANDSLLIKLGVWSCEDDIGILYTSYGQTIINGDQITTGGIDAKYINTKDLTVQSLEAGPVKINYQGISVKGDPYRYETEDENGNPILVEENFNIDITPEKIELRRSGSTDTIGSFVSVKADAAIINNALLDGKEAVVENDLLVKENARLAGGYLMIARSADGNVILDIVDALESV